MFALLASLLLAFSVSGTVRAGTHALIERLSDGANARVHDKVHIIVGGTAQRSDDDEDASDDQDPSDDDSDADAVLEVVPPRAPLPPPPPGKPGLVEIGNDANADLPRFSWTAHGVPAVRETSHVSSQPSISPIWIVCEDSMSYASVTIAGSVEWSRT